MNVIAWLRTPIATLIVLCAALLSQMPHAADVFRILVAGEGFWAVAHGYAYAVALELAVLLFVVQRRNAESYVFAGVSILVNLSYYALHGTNLFAFAALPAWLVSIALPAAIARYSHLLVEAPEAAHTQTPTTPAESPQKAATPSVKHNSAVITVSEEMAASAPPSEAGSGLSERTEPAEPVKLTPEQRRAHIRKQEFIDAAQVVAQFGVSLRTAQQDLAAVRNAATQANGKAVRA
jgi:hypothetical protein